MDKLLVITTESELKSDIYEKTYRLLCSMVNDGVLLLDKRFNYEIIEIGKNKNRKEN